MNTSRNNSVFQYTYSLLNPTPQPKTWYEELEEQACSFCPSMTWEQRITGCLVCIVLGFLISMGSTFRLIKLMKGDPMPFATMYTTGNLIGLASTCFLYGPWQQMKKMFASTRLFATGAYLFFMALTLFLAFYPYEIPLRLLWLVFSIFLQFLALIWYSLSFVPFARQIALQCMKKCCCAQLNSSEEDIFGL